MRSEPKFIKASSSPSDPVGHIGVDWGFWDESWAHWHGGFANEAVARAGLRAYAASL